MPHRTSTHIHFFAALMLAASSHAAGAEPAQMDVAHRSYHLGQYQRSLALYELLASQGHAEAAERAGYMLMMGPMTCGAQVPRNVTRATELLEQAAMAGRPHAFFLLEMAGQAD